MLGQVMLGCVKLDADTSPYFMLFQISWG